MNFMYFSMFVLRKGFHLLPRRSNNSEDALGYLACSPPASHWFKFKRGPYGGVLRTGARDADVVIDRAKAGALCLTGRLCAQCSVVV